jgi:hypothetical protein
MNTTDHPTLVHAFEFAKFGCPAAFKFEIPGFEGWKPALGRKTDAIKKVLTNQDALALIIDYLCEKQHKPCADAERSDIITLARLWKNPSSMVAAQGHFPGWADCYFNTSYGYLGENFDSERAVGGLQQALAKEGTKQYWYRVRRGHYSLTSLGQKRVTELLHMNEQKTTVINQAQTTVVQALTKRESCANSSFVVITVHYTDSTSEILAKVNYARNLRKSQARLCNTTSPKCTDENLPKF